MRVCHIIRAAAVSVTAFGLLAAIDSAASAQDHAADAPQAVTTDAPSEDAAELVQEEGLAKQLANPISNLISVPFQFNLDAGLGPDGKGHRGTLNIQPVIPFSVSNKWNLIVRTIVPVTVQGADVAGKHVFGLGDTVQSFFFSPKQPTSGGIIWGVGPVLLYPTATNRLLGAEKWGAGPTFVALKQSNGWTIGALGNHIWSFAGKGSRQDISVTFVQPFLTYTWPSTVGVSLSSETAYNWNAKTWIVPINLSVSRVVRLGNQPASVGLGGRYYVVSPAGGPNWGVRATFTLLFPKRPRG